MKPSRPKASLSRSIFSKLTIVCVFAAVVAAATDGTANSLDQRCLHQPDVRGNKAWRLRHWSKARHGKDLNQSNKTVRKYDRPDDQQADVSPKVERKASTKHEQHEAQERLSLFPPADEQTGPKRHQYTGCYWPKDSSKVQNATADHSGGNGGDNPELTIRVLHAAPLRVVNSNKRL